MHNALAFKTLIGHGQSRRRRNLNEKEKFAIVTLAEANLKQSGIAKQFKLSRSAICKIIKNHRETESTIRRKKDHNQS